MATSRLTLSVFVALCIASALGHSYVTSPTTRSNQKQSNAGCRGPNCLGPCDVPLSQARTAAVTIARGASINVQWPRNNHAGGFIRLAWAQTSGSDEHANFDANVQEIVCHEVGGCGPDNANEPNGGDSGPSDGSSRPCQTTITVPLHLADGSWTLQWAWFGGAFSLGDYYSCVDYKIAGGPSSSKLDAVFIGGDYTYPGQNKCKFFNTDRLHQCKNEPCENPLYSAAKEQSGPAYMGASSNTKPVATTARLTTATKSDNKPITSGVKINSQMTTAKMTTGKVSSAPTSLTTGTKSTNTNTVANCASLTKVVDSTVFEIISLDTWSDVFRMEVKIKANEAISNWMLQIVWPEGASSTEVEQVYNAGELKCTASVPSRHSMIAPANWVGDLKSGEEVTIEIMATNTNMNSQFLKANTKFKLLKK